MVIKTQVSSEIHKHLLKEYSYLSETNEYSFEKVLVELNEYSYSFETNKYSFKGVFTLKMGTHADKYV